MIVVKSSFNSEDAVALNKNVLKKNFWIFIIFAALFVIFGISELLGEDSSVVLAVTCFVLAVLVPLLLYAVSLSAVKKNLKTNKMLAPDTVQTFSFSDDGVRVQQQNEHFKGDDVFDWTCIFNAVENKGYIFFYLSSVQSHIMKKADFEQGSLAELKELLKEKLGSKFKGLKG